MSYNRLRRLAGLNESFTNNARLNAEIEDQVATQTPGTQHHWMDLLEAIYQAGRNGISREQIASYLGSMYGHHAEWLESMLAELPAQFGNMVEVNGDRFVWKYPTANDLDLDEIDPKVRTAVGAQVNLSSRTMEVMRRLTQQHGSFTVADLARNVRAATGVPLALAVQFSDHMITQFRSMLRQQGDHYALIEEPPVRNADTMNFLRDLAKNPKHDLPDDDQPE
jgi:hypothetical protein